MYDAPPPPPAEVSLDVPAMLPDAYVPLESVKLDLYRRLAAASDVAAVLAIRDEVRDRFGPVPEEAERFFHQSQLRLVGGTLGIETVLVHKAEARVSFRADAVPRMKDYAAAFRDVQFQVDVRRVTPLSLKLTRLGATPLLEGLVRALRSLNPSAS